MIIVVVGATGQLGSEFCRILHKGYCELGDLPISLKNINVVELSSKQLDISCLNSVVELITKLKPDCVINCAAFTNVDECESSFELAFKVNAIGARNLAIACDAVNSKLVHISTDYVFDGCSTKPYVETDLCNPKNVYGKTKLLAEEYVRSFCNKWFIIRTSWLFGLTGKNFVKIIAKLAYQNGEVTVVADQFGTPTNVVDLVFSICELLTTNEFGIYHGSCKGSCSWHEFAREIVKNFKIKADVNSCTTNDFKRPATRPKFSVMDNLMFSLTIGDKFRPWKQALESYCNQIELADL